MISSFSRNFLVDSCFWIALFDARDERHSLAGELEDVVFSQRVLVPFPCLYEFLGTRFSRRPLIIEEIDRTFIRSKVQLIPDELYRNSIIERYIASSRTGRTLSAVDIIINAMLEDINLRVHGLITFNVADFAPMCRKRSIQLISGV